mgnify:CR=1 FL=1
MVCRERISGLGLARIGLWSLEAVMKVLFYGGCHASALKDIFQRVARGNHEFSALTNYLIIQEGKPFPYEILPTIDAIVFSPIRNKGAWNTSHLEERCSELNIPYISYPWLQWNGYFPGIRKIEGIPPHVWGLAPLMDALERGASVDDLEREATLNPSLESQAKAFAADATKQLRMHEEGVDIPISGFVETRHRDERLFYTPDHPAPPIYKHVVEQIAGRLGIQRRLFGKVRSPHTDRLPILPVVAKALRLRFEATEFALENQPKPIPLRDYLARLHLDFHRAKAEDSAGVDPR